MSQSHPNYVTNALGEFAFAGATGQGRLFRKEVIRAGTYQHPVNPWPEALDADRAYLERVALNTNEAIARGIQVPIPDTHNDKPEDNKGYVRRAFVDEVDGEPALFIDAEIIDPETLPKVGNTIRSVSGWFTGTGDGEWAPNGDRLRHVALTSYPVASRQGNFVALSGEDAVDSAPAQAAVLTRAQPKETPVKFNDAQIAALKALGIEAGDDMAATFDALIAKAQAEPKIVERPAAITPEDAPRALSIDGAKTPYFAQFRAERAKRLDDEVNAAKAAGRLNEDGAKALKTLLSVDHGFALSDEGVAASADVAAAARALVASIPDNAVVPVEKRLSQGDPIPQKIDPDPVDAKALADEALKSAGMGT